MVQCLFMLVFLGVCVCVCGSHVAVVQGTLLWFGARLTSKGAPVRNDPDGEIK